MVARRANLFQTQHILHVIKAGYCRYNKPCGTKRSFCKCITGMSLVHQLDAFPDCTEADGVFADDIAGPQSMDADFFGSSLASDSFSSMTCVFFKIPSERFRDNFGKPVRGA